MRQGLAMLGDWHSEQSGGGHHVQRSCGRKVLQVPKVLQLGASNI